MDRLVIQQEVVMFRADASVQIGSGHIMRCLTMADALRQQGAECHFLCRAHTGNLIEQIREKGYTVHVLPVEVNDCSEIDCTTHSIWLGSTQARDAQICQSIIHALNPSWLIVDHYALDRNWENKLKPYCQRLMVIDDLADRPHSCDLLLDQNLGRQSSDYDDLLCRDCVVLIGPQYALLRPEFTQLRAYSLERRKQPVLRSLLVSMGGVDQQNSTGQILEALKECALPDNCQITVVMGSKALWLDQVRAVAREMSWTTEVLVNVSDMAQRIADCDIAIGAAGGTAWERCSLGVVTVIVVLANNQWPGARALASQNAAHLLGDISSISLLPSVLSRVRKRNTEWRNMSLKAAQISDGLGVNRVVDSMIRLMGNE